MPADAARRYWGLPALAPGQGLPYACGVAVTAARRLGPLGFRSPSNGASCCHRGTNGDLAAFFVPT